MISVYTPFLESSIEYFLVFGGLASVASFTLGFFVGQGQATRRARGNAAYLLPEFAVWSEAGQAEAEVKAEDLVPELAARVREREMRLFVERLAGIGSIRYVVRSPQLDEGLAIHPRSGEAVPPLLGSPSTFRTADARFDELVRARGDPLVLTAVLTPTVRRRLVALADEGFRVADQRLILTVPIEQHRAQGELQANLRRCVELVDALCIPLEDVRARLAANIRAERSAGARRSALELFLRSFGQTPEREALIELGLHDASVEVRFVAAAALPCEEPRAQAVLAALAGDGRVEAETRLAALRRLSELSVEGALPAVIDEAIGLALGSARVELQAAAATLAGRGRSRTHVPHLLVLATAAHSGAQVEALRALALVGDASLESRLWPALHAPNVEVVAAAAFALGKLGTLASVVPLRAAADGWSSPDVKVSARRAIGLIQARHGAGEGGALSLTGDVEGRGALSVAAEGGAMALAGAEAGALAVAVDVSSRPGALGEGGAAGEGVASARAEDEGDARSREAGSAGKDRAPPAAQREEG